MKKEPNIEAIITWSVIFLIQIITIYKLIKWI